jgi:hypothetical protein
MTSYGEKLVLANSAYVYTVTNAQIRLYERTIELLETRILCYGNLAKRRLRSSTNIEIPPWYSDNISDYWEIAGLPRTISGTFFSPGIGDFSVQVPATLSIVPSPVEQAISGWFFSIGESNNFSIFIESRNSAKMIYSRKGKTPQKQKLQLDGVLYINNNANAPTEQDVIERCLRPYLLTGITESINARIIFDGKTFEIREYPIQRSSSPLFRGIID